MEHKTPKVLFIGSKRLGLRILKIMRELSPESLLGALTIDDLSDSRSAYEDFQTFSSENRVVLHTANGRKDAERRIIELRPDLCVVSGWYWIISKSALAAVPRGFIGLQPSLLPQYRGSAPVVWAIINGDRGTGYSLFSFSEKMDEGDIWLQNPIPISPQDYIGDVLLNIELAVEKSFHENYLSILSGRLKPTKQANSPVSYCAARTPDDGDIDWKQPAKAIYDFIRAQSVPYPGAYSWYKGEKMIIWRAHLFENLCYGTPGQVAQFIDGRACVVCGDHRALILDDIEWMGMHGPSALCITSVKPRFSKMAIAR